MTKGKRIIIYILSIVCLVAAGLTLLFCLHPLFYRAPKFTIKDTLADGQGKSATVILLGGQSNATGCAASKYLKNNVSESKYLEYKNGYDNVYINYYSSETNVSKKFVKCALGTGESKEHFGLEVGLAEKLHEAHPDELFFIIKYTKGDTSLHKDWLAPSSIGYTGRRYKNFVAFVNTSINYLVSKNYNVKINAMCWMQGEADSISKSTATVYQTNLVNFIKDMRQEFVGFTGPGGMAFIDAYIADNPSVWPFHSLINQAKTTVANSLPNNALVDTIANNLDTSAEPTEKPDLLHYDSTSLLKLGQLFAEQLEQFL